MLEPEVCDLIADDAISWEDEPMRQLADSGELMAYQHQGFWQPMDTLRDKQQLEALWRTNRAPWRIWDR